MLGALPAEQSQHSDSGSRSDTAPHGTVHTDKRHGTCDSNAAPDAETGDESRGGSETLETTAQ